MNRLLTFIIALACAVVGIDVAAQTYPMRPVRIVAGSAPGSILDIAARQIADKLGPALGQTVIVEPKPSGGGILAMETVARSAPDGYTLGIGSFVELGVNASLYDKLPYDPVKDFAPVILMYRAPLALVSNPSQPVATLADLIRLAKAQPGKITYGSSGVARPPHIFMELFKNVAGIDITHIPYRGAPPAAVALLSNEVGFLMETASAVIPQIKDGKMRPLAVTGEARIATIPDVPTFSESAVPGIGASWVGIVAPAGTPRDIVARLHREIAQALASPDIKKYYDSAGRTTASSTSEDFAAMIRDEVKKWPEIVKKANIRPE